MAKPQATQLTLDEAYQATFLWLDHVGDPPLDISEPAHGSVELRTEKAFVRVRFSDGPVEQSSVLALLRAAETGKKLLLFSPSGFSPGALSIAETQGIALFTLDLYGQAIPETTHARAVSPETEPDPPFSPPPVEEESESLWSQRTPLSADTSTSGAPDDEGEEAAAKGIDATATDWSDCPSCGTTHYRAANFCKSCGTSLQEGQTTTDTSPRCKDCGSHNIEHV